MISAVIPVFNEDESLQAFYDVLKKEIVLLDKSYEFIFIDDGSKDGSFTLLKKLQKEDKHIRLFSFRRNQGKSEALTLGFQRAKGDYIVTLDADLQDRPEEIGKLLAKAKEGYDVVSGWRKERKDAARMKIISKLYNYMVGYIWGVKLHDYNCGLKVYTKEAAKHLRLYGGLHRFIPLLAFEQGFRITELPTLHEKRKFGKSKYGFSKILDLPDIFTILFLTRYNQRPLHFFGLIGGIFIGIGSVIVMYFTLIHTLYHTAIGGRPLLFIGLVLIISGFQIGFTGFLADLIIHSTREVHAEEMQIGLLKYDTDLNR